jgi:hypothetical protein
MTAFQNRLADEAVPALAVRARDVLVSEWTKLRSVRSTYLALLIAAVTALGISAVLALTNANRSTAGPPDPMLPTFVGLPYAVLALGVLGILAFTSEHATGLIRTTLAAVPRRRSVLAAKAAVAGAVALLTGELLSFSSFFLVQAILSGRHQGISLSHPGALGSVLAEGTLLFFCVMLGTGLGAIIRYTPGAVAALFGVIAVPAILLFVPAPWSDRIGRFTLLYAAKQVVVLHPQGNLFSPGLSMLVLLAWPAVVLVAAAILITRQDT